eukprot:CAMPEP_0185165748 /NCGR_PEP_ID=MMETSP1139-20130426/11355_1 /TAXON_ID=298111 /ORGANISM="Pavlova sp., Strain CCMP459" /LENGTH=62 /DNA_ID=CAMNT_0027731157 /DNA_START=626 /DNA_END=814 /DNA_ORIENTATION=-
MELDAVPRGQPHVQHGLLLHDSVVCIRGVSPVHLIRTQWKLTALRAIGDPLAKVIEQAGVLV